MQRQIRLETWWGDANVRPNPSLERPFRGGFLFSWFSHTGTQTPLFSTPLFCPPNRHTHARAHTRACTHTHTHTHTRAHERKSTNTNTHARTHTHTDTHRHKNTHARKAHGKTCPRTIAHGKTCTGDPPKKTYPESVPKKRPRPPLQPRYGDAFFPLHMCFHRAVRVTSVPGTPLQTRYGDAFWSSVWGQFVGGNLGGTTFGNTSLRRFWMKKMRPGGRVCPPLRRGKVSLSA